MDLRQLETFIEVADLKSFSKAADKLFITQPTVTNHIQNLEKELGTLLINRSGKNISLTDAGVLLYKYAVNIINSCDMAKFDLAAYKGKIQGHIQIYSSSVPRKYILPKIIYDFSKKYPDVSFSLLDNDSKNVTNSILNADTDFGIVGAKYNSKNLNYINLTNDNLLFITPNTEEWNKENFSNIKISEILDKKFILREEGSGTRNILENELNKNNISFNNLNILAYIEDSETIKELVSLGAGVSFISEKAIKNNNSNYNFKVFNIEELNLNRDFYFVYHNKRQLSPLNETFKNFMIDYINNNQ